MIKNHLEVTARNLSYLEKQNVESRIQGLIIKNLKELRWNEAQCSKINNVSIF